MKQAHSSEVAERAPGEVNGVLTDAVLQTSAKPEPLGRPAIPPGEIREISITDLFESERNPRKYFAPKKMAELVDSMTKGGFWAWNPIMARPLASRGYEIGAGHRRFRAAKSAGLETVPAVIRPMDDAQFLRVLTFDNSNREDPHPLDEAAGFRFYMEQTGQKVDDIAAEIGQSRAYVYQRLKYADLIEPAREAFWDERITGGHAILIARLQPRDQKAALDRCKHHRDEIPSVRDLAAWIERVVHRDVKKACFDAKSAQLSDGVPACTDCPKRVGNSRELFPDVKNADTCTDPTCFERKEQAHIQIRLAERNSDPDPAKPPLLKISTSYSYGEEPPAGVLSRDAFRVIEGKNNVCDYTADAIVIQGDDRGRTVRVCANKSCKMHGSHANHRSPLYLAAEKRRKEEARRAELVIAGVRAAVREKAAVPLGLRELQFVACSMVEYLRSDALQAIAKAWKIEAVKKQMSWGMTQDLEGPVVAHVRSLPLPELARSLIYLAVCQLADESALAAAKTFTVDVKAIEKSVTSAPVESKPPAPSPAAKKAKAPAKAKTGPRPGKATPPKKAAKKKAGRRAR